MYHVGVFTLQGAFHIQIYDTLRRHLVLYIVVNQLGVVLGAHAGKGLSFRLRNTQTFKGFLDVLGHVFPVVLHIAVRTHVGGNVIHIQSLDGRTPVRHL